MAWDGNFESERVNQKRSAMRMTYSQRVTIDL